MRAIAIIPARMGSSRFPGKPLAKICGVPMVGHCFYRTQMCDELSGTYVATCDQEIYDYVTSIGGNVVITSLSYPPDESPEVASVFVKIILAASVLEPVPEVRTIVEIRTGSNSLTQNSPVFAAASNVHSPVPELNTFTSLVLD